jgi:hypothetical protein
MEASMHPQLQAIADDLTAARDRLHALAARLPDTRWATRPDPDRWSVAECVAHLNLTGEAYLPILRGALAEARALGTPPPERYRRDFAGWVLGGMLSPPVRIRVKTSAPFVPEGALPPEALRAEFHRLQDAQIACVAEADGLPLTGVKVTSPFDARVRYNLYSCFALLAPHQHRHLWQAERVAASLEGA